MSDGEERARRSAADWMNRLGDWSEEDPDVLALPGEKAPVVADVNGDLRVLHSGLVYARRVEHDEIRQHIEEHRADPRSPRVASLSEFSHRFDRSGFEDLPAREAGAGGRDEAVSGEGGSETRSDGGQRGVRLSWDPGHGIQPEYTHRNELVGVTITHEAYMAIALQSTVWLYPMLIEKVRQRTEEEGNVLTDPEDVKDVLEDLREEFSPEDRPAVDVPEDLFDREADRDENDGDD